MVLVVDDLRTVSQTCTFDCGGKPEIANRRRGFGRVSSGFRSGGLKPDLVLLDNALPSLKGIEAPRQIGNLVPESKIIFLSLSQETSAEVVQEAFALGARGYLVKARAGSEVFAAVDAGIFGKSFASNP